MQWLRRQRYLVALVALSLVLKVMIAGGHVPSAVAASLDQTPASAGETSASTGFSTVVICTPSGLFSVTLDANGDPVDTPGTPAAATDCGLCSALQFGAVALAPDSSVLDAPRPSTTLPLAGPTSACTPKAPRLARGHDPPQI